MTFRDVSVIDYTIVSGDLFNYLYDFSISAMDSLFLTVTHYLASILA